MTDSPSSLAELLGTDHHELDRLLEEFQAAGPDERDRRSAVFREFAVRLRRHILVEEERLFPLYGAGDPGRQAVVETMLDEHRRIRDALLAIEERLAAGGGSTGELEVDLINVLWAHNAREETQVYPWLDEHVAAERADEVARSLREPK